MKNILVIGATIALSTTLLAATNAPTVQVSSKNLYKMSYSEILNNNIQYFKYGVGVDPITNLPYDHITLDSSLTQITNTGKFFNPTEAGLYLDVLMAVAKNEIPNTVMTPAQAKVRMIKTLNSLIKIQDTLGWNGLFNWYQIMPNGQIAPNGYGGVSSVDNGNMAFGLAAVIGGMAQYNDSESKEIVKLGSQILNSETTGWSQLYSPQKGLLMAGYDYNNKQVMNYYIDRTYNETRSSVIWAILTTKDLPSGYSVPVTAFSNMTRTFTPYTLGGANTNILMTWDGSIFQAFLPQLFINETEYSPFIKLEDSLNLQAQQVFCKDNGIPALLSAASTVGYYGYSTYGVPNLAETHVVGGGGENSSAGTPYANALIGPSNLKYAVNSLQGLAQNYPQVVTPYGFIDAIDAQGKTANTLIALDQEFLLLGLLGKDNQNDVQIYLKQQGDMALLKNIYASINSSKIPSGNSVVSVSGASN